MKDEEIKQSAIDEAQNYDDPDVRTVVCNSFRKGLKLGLKKRDEYAEEYAKAAIRHTMIMLAEFDRTGRNISRTTEAKFFLESFKESLKK